MMRMGQMRIESLAWKTTIILTVAVLAAACSRDAGRFGPPATRAAPPPAPTAAPTPQVTTQPLPPPDALDIGGPVDGDTQVAALPSAAEPPSREDVLGQWSVAAEGDRCQLFVALTSWEGGYRASTRNCSAPELTNVGAWNLEGDLVVLKDNDGNPLARLARSGATQYDGRLELGGSISMNR
jgi:hypothetical protein